MCLKCGSQSTQQSVNPPPTRTILMSNDSSSSSHLLGGDWETVWKRETCRENRDTRKDDRYPVRPFFEKKDGEGDFSACLVGGIRSVKV